MWNRLDDQMTQQTWDAFVAKHGPVSGRFLQSWGWGEFTGGERWTLSRNPVTGETALREGKSVRGVATVVKKRIPGMGFYAYCPRGPVVGGEVSEGIEVRAVRELALQIKKILFFRFDLPQRSFGQQSWFQNDRNAKKASKNVSRIKPTFPVQPPMTRMTDLSPTEGELMAAMHHKLRYNIRVAERSDVRIRFDMQDLSLAWHLFEGTASRGQFRLHPMVYYERMLSVLTGNCRAFLATAWYEEQPIAANIMVDFAGVRTYLHGASSYEHRFLMAPHLLHWELIRDAKLNGLTVYDWWGVSPENNPIHPWAGVSRFKRQFPGQDIHYPGTYDLVKRPVWYRVYTLARALRRTM